MTTHRVQIFANLLRLQCGKLLGFGHTGPQLLHVRGYYGSPHDFELIPI